MGLRQNREEIAGSKMFVYSQGAEWPPTISVGFANGSVTIIRGDFIHDRGTKQRIVFESQDPITALQVRQGTTKVLYIATLGKISSLVISGKGQGQPVRTVDNRGCHPGCMTFEPSTNDLIVARDDAVYYYGVNGRGPSYAFDGPKKLVKTYKDYVGLVCPPRVAQISKSKTFRRLGADDVDDIFSSSSFTLLDTDLRYVAYTEALPAPPKDVFVIWDELFLLTEDGKLFRYQEKTLQQKLDILYQRDLYILAINLAQKYGVDVALQNMIFRKYGDHLYQKGDYDTAMQQYLRAVDNTEPSQVIRKYLDTQRIHNLIDYLEELHEHNKATADHTTLLLNCYAKMKDTEKLDKFIRTPGELKFDPDTAIPMCRQGGYYEQAAYLATKNGDNELVIDILIEDLKKYAEALQYIWRLEPEAAYPVLMKYPRVLIEHCPTEATKIFIDYYTGQYKPREDVPAVADIQPEASGGAFQSLSVLWTLPFVGGRKDQTVPAAPVPKPEAELVTNEAPEILPLYEKPKPRSAFSSFVDHPTEFIAFLEALLKQTGLAHAEKVDLTTALFEMYLESANKTVDKNEKDAWQQKAKSLIVESDVKNTGVEPSIDTSNVLLLSSLSRFPTGTTLIRERASLYPDIFRSYTSAKDTTGAISALRKYGQEDLSLYVLALSYFASSDKIIAEPGVKEEVGTCLQKIDQERLLAPLQVVKILSQGGAMTMGMVKDYLATNISRERREIQSNRRLADSYRTETAAKKNEIEELNTKPIVFQARRCSSCGGGLDLPVVHFMCKHSFHQRCLNTRMGVSVEDADCPICQPGNDTIKRIRRVQIESADQHDIFRRELERSTDRFGTVSEFFGRGVMTVAAPTE
ncbi:Vacuolar protein sorting-associated protein 11 [Lithohypha guttulata]|uniref:E3 ubiquitin-protein ligase PEP5 n=1 Tax=Lithohypha guttulata TaxID=1690604 RepID=A0AAN7SZZ4_9EURO|nr:Vacuolar protein sorting-associated protein 11 [Lithohypha guttulata]KAK5103725.1 Vacuolar protein sorting-associated protein 11 [Lithohypha guttulata]